MSDTPQTTPYVKVMAEYSSDGVWDHDGVSIGAEDVPVSDPLRARLHQWCEWYEKSEFYLPKAKQAPFDVEAFSSEGREIARSIKAELPNWTVVYFDEKRAHAHPPLDCIYEV